MKGHDFSGTGWPLHTIRWKAVQDPWPLVASPRSGCFLLCFEFSPSGIPPPSQHIVAPEWGRLLPVARQSPRNPPQPAPLALLRMKTPPGCSPEPSVLAGPSPLPSLETNTSLPSVAHSPCTLFKPNPLIYRSRHNYLTGF